MDNKRQMKVVRLLMLVFVIALTIFIILIRDKLRGFEEYGYPGIFFISILANATIIIPVPGVVLTAAMGAVFNPFWVAVAAGSGAAIGELTGYLAGYSGAAVIENKSWHDRLVKWMERFGGITILILATIPNPLFDLAGITAGVLKMSWYRYLFWCWLGKILKMLMFAYGGAIIATQFPK